MLKNYLTIALRNLRKNKTHSFINITGLSVGMAVAFLIGLWISDELSFDTWHSNYKEIAQVTRQVTINGKINTDATIPLALEAEMRKTYGRDFKHIVMTAWTESHILSVDDKHISYPGNFVGSEAPEMLSLHMLKGTRGGLAGPTSMLISASVARALFGEADPMDKIITMDNKATFKVSGVYDDLPPNTTFHDMAFMAPWDFFAAAANWIGRSPTDWSDNSLFMYVQLDDHADINGLSAKIKNIIVDHAGPAETKLKPRLFLQPMSKWHLYSEFNNGVNSGGAIQYVWLFGVIGSFVLLLACINFMNLSTARSGKRAKEVGIRKSVGSLRSQLIVQFFSESLLMSLLAFACALLLVSLCLPFFNQISARDLRLPWRSIPFWSLSLAFTLFTGLVAGSYPALYLSSFRAVEVLKGTARFRPRSGVSKQPGRWSFKAGRMASLPREVLVVLQFSVSVILIIGTIIVFRQIEFAKDRPVGYTREGLLYIETATTDLHDHFSALRTSLLQTGAIADVAESSSPTTGLNNGRGDVSWPGKDPSFAADFGFVGVTNDYGKTIGWQFTEGRDFSADFHADSAKTVVLNQSAVSYMNLKQPIGAILHIGKFDYSVVGIVKDMVMGSPYEPVKPTIFRLAPGPFDYVDIRINPTVSTHQAVETLQKVCKLYAPAIPFSCRFVDDEYAAKFRNEERVGRLAGVFAGLAIFISCLGLFGMASFMAEQRTREIGVRKVMGASVLDLWALMSRSFVGLVSIALLIAIPLAYLFMQKWLMHYAYRSVIPWWAFVATAAGALLITLLTVSYQGIRAATMNPVKALRTE